MRRSLGWVAAASLIPLLLAAGTAFGAPLNFSGTSTVILSDLGNLPLTGGGVATINNSSGVIPAHLTTIRLKASRGNVGGTNTVLITDPVSGPGNAIAKVIIQATVGTGTLAPISGGPLSLSQNVLPVEGLAKICLADVACTSFLELPLVQPITNNGVTTALKGVGVGGLLFVGNNKIKISIEAAPWTINTAFASDQIETPNGGTSIVTLMGGGFAHGPVSLTTSTAQPSGVVQLVTPAQVTTNLPFGTADVLGIILIYTVHFIPEPGLLLLLGSGVVGLALIGRKKMRR